MLDANGQMLLDSHILNDPKIKELFGMFPDCRWISMPDYTRLVNDRWEAIEPGYKVRKRYVQFCTAIPTPYHEIGHMVEMKNFSRLVQDDWGIKHPIPFDRPTPYYFAAMARECRVRGIQSHFDGQETLSQGFKGHWIEGQLKPRQVNVAAHSLPYGRFTSCDDVWNWADSIFQSARKKYDMERIIGEWKKRVEYIRNWQETK